MTTCKVLTNLPNLSAECPYVPAGRPRSCATIDPLKWRETLPGLGVFDLILLHHSLPHAEEKVTLLLRSGQALLEMAKEACPQIFTFRYSDRELDAFCEEISADRRYLSRFLSELQGAGQIAREQYRRIAGKYQLEERSSPPPSQPDDLFPLIQECLTHHMQKGSKLICVLKPPHSKYEDPQFFEQIITHPSLDYQEKSSEDETLIIIEKL
jgi:hypothetical protein